LLHVIQDVRRGELNVASIPEPLALGETVHRSEPCVLPTTQGGFPDGALSLNSAHPDNANYSGKYRKFIQG